MQKIKIETNKDYTLFKLPTNLCTPYVVAYKYDEERDCWAQGYYFDNLQEAVKKLYK